MRVFNWTRTRMSMSTKRTAIRTFVSKMSVLLCTSQLFSTSGKSSGRGFVQFTPAEEKCKYLMSHVGLNCWFKNKSFRTHCNTGRGEYS